MSSQISPAELGRMQTDAKHWLSEAGQLVRVTATPNNKGGKTNVRTVIWSGLLSRRPMSESGREAMEAITGDLQTQLSHWIFTLPAGVDVKPQDEIVVGARTFSVVGGIDKSHEISRYVIAIEHI